MKSLDDVQQGYVEKVEVSQEERMEEQKPARPGNPFDWLLGGAFAVTGLVALFKNPVVALLMFLMAAIMLPPASQRIESVIPFKLSRPVKLLVIAFCMYIFSKVR